jgi:hypothetical protein
MVSTGVTVGIVGNGEGEALEESQGRFNQRLKRLALSEMIVLLILRRS